MKVSHSLSLEDRLYLKKLFDIPDNKTELYALKFDEGFHTTFYIKGKNILDFTYNNKQFLWDNNIEMSPEDMRTIIRMLYTNYQRTVIKNKLA